jgi:hypothetical protein
MNTLELQAYTDTESDVVIEHTEAEVAAENTASVLEDDAVKPQDANDNKSTQDAATAGQSSTEQTDTD